MNVNTHVLVNNKEKIINNKFGVPHREGNISCRKGDTHFLFFLIYSFLVASFSVIRKQRLNYFLKIILPDLS